MVQDHRIVNFLNELENLYENLDVIIELLLLLLFKILCKIERTKHSKTFTSQRSVLFPS